MTTIKTFQDGDWKFETWNMAGSGVPGFRRYHLHDGRWSQVRWKLDTDGNYVQDSYLCNTCSEPIPKRMEGLINLMEWKR